MMMTDFITRLCYVITSEGKTQEKESKGKTKENKMQISTTFFFFSSLPSIFPKRTNEINIFLKKKNILLSFPIKNNNNNNKKRSKPATICVHHKMHYMQKKKTNKNSLQPNKQKMKQKKNTNSEISLKNPNIKK